LSAAIRSVRIIDFAHAIHAFKNISGCVIEDAF